MASKFDTEPILTIYNGNSFSIRKDVEQGENAHKLGGPAPVKPVPGHEVTQQDS